MGTFRIYILDLQTDTFIQPWNIHCIKGIPLEKLRYRSSIANARPSGSIQKGSPIGISDGLNINTSWTWMVNLEVHNPHCKIEVSITDLKVSPPGWDRFDREDINLPSLFPHRHMPVSRSCHLSLQQEGNRGNKIASPVWVGCGNRRVLDRP